MIWAPKSLSPSILYCLTLQKTGRLPVRTMPRSIKSAKRSSTVASYAGIIVMYEYLKSVRIPQSEKSRICNKMLFLTCFRQMSRFLRMASEPVSGADSSCLREFGRPAVQVRLVSVLPKLSHNVLKVTTPNSSRVGTHVVHYIRKHFLSAAIAFAHASSRCVLLLRQPSLSLVLFQLCFVVKLI